METKEEKQEREENGLVSENEWELFGKTKKMLRTF